MSLGVRWPERATPWLFAALFFFLPIHIAPVYQLTLVLLLVTLLGGNWTRLWQRVRGEPLFWIFQAFFWVFVLSLLWTQDMAEGWRAVRRYGLFLLSGLYLAVARREWLPRCVAFFLAGCAFCEVLAYYNWVQMHWLAQWPVGIRLDNKPEDTAPFVDRILYAPALAWAGYLTWYRAWAAQGWQRGLWAVLGLATTVNLVFSGGRAGQVTFLALVALLVLQRLRHQPWKAAAGAVVVVTGLAGISYNASPYLRERVDLALHEATHREAAVNTSVGLRLNFYANSLRLWAQEPLLGVGAGDFTQEYARVNAQHSPAWLTTVNPHNQYLFVLACTGVLGALVLGLVLCPPALWQGWGDALSDWRVGLAVFAAVVCLFESYLWRSNTAALFVLFSTLLMRSPQPATRRDD